MWFMRGDKEAGWKMLYEVKRKSEGGKEERERKKEKGEREREEGEKGERKKDREWRK